MIIQSGSRPGQEAPPVGRPGDDAPKPVAAASSAGAGRATVEVLHTLATPVAAPKATSEQLKQAVEEINRAMRQSNRNLEFSVDDATSRVVVRLTDTETGEVIRQIPSEETLAISRSIGEFQQGLLLKQKA